VRSKRRKERRQKEKEWTFWWKRVDVPWWLELAHQVLAQGILVPASS